MPGLTCDGHLKPFCLSVCLSVYVILDVFWGSRKDEMWCPVWKVFDVGWGGYIFEKKIFLKDSLLLNHPKVQKDVSHVTLFVVWRSGHSSLTKWPKMGIKRVDR